MSAQDKSLGIPETDPSDTAAIEHEERVWAKPDELKPSPETQAQIVSSKETLARLSGQLGEADESVQREQIAIDARAERESKQRDLALERTAHHERAVAEANARAASTEVDSDSA